jgi:hypothetical protein
MLRKIWHWIRWEQHGAYEVQRDLRDYFEIFLFVWIFAGCAMLTAMLLLLILQTLGVTG